MVEELEYFLKLSHAIFFVHGVKMNIMEKRENNNLIQQEGQFVAQNSEKGEISALEVAKYLLSLDPQRQYFTLERITRQEG
jgi:hypothetical protein